MLSRLKLAGVLMILVLGLSVAWSDFDCGSDGGDGALAISGTYTLDLPEDGIFNFTTVNIEAGATLKFNHNSLNTPVYILAQGDIIISGTIDVSGASGTQSPPMGGKGGPGGFEGGAPKILGADAGYGHGPGGGKPGTNDHPNNSASAGAGSYGATPTGDDYSSSDGKPYGSPLLVPLIGGSGGGGGTTGQPSRGGGGGGGAILLASNSRIVVSSTGKIQSRGGHNADSPNFPNQGSGGAIRLVSPTVGGTGTLDVRGGYTTHYFGCEGGGGRIRIDAIDRSNITFSFQPISVVSIGSYMAVFPTPLPHLDIISAAGQAITEGTASAVQILLPFDAPTTQTVTVKASNFKGIVPIRIVVHPENGEPENYDREIDMGESSTAQISVDVQVPKNTLVSIYVWTR